MDITTGTELLALCESLHLPISAVARRLEAERSGKPEAEITEQMARSMAVMRNSYREPLEEPLTSEFRMIGGEGRLLREHFRAGKSILGPLFSKIVYRSMAILEQNASMGLIVAAPTAGSSGVLPGALFSLQEESGLSDETVLQGLFCAGAIGQLMMRNGTVSGAEAGCQAEVGAASAMAAAATAEMYGGTPRACLDAASLALTNLLGLVCDPVAGLVQCPCQTRNALGAANGVLCAEMTLSGMRSFIPFDEMVKALYDVGRRLPKELRETALGGCAATPTGLAWKEKIFGRD
jgi:L-serine dehydratase, iron-sulfur-dependent, alpha subunit